MTADKIKPDITAYWFPQMPGFVRLGLFVTQSWNGY